MAAKFEFTRAEFTLEAGFTQPDFRISRHTEVLLQHLYSALEPHGIRLTDIRVERGAGGAADWHILCNLLDLMLTIRVRMDRVEFYSPQLRREYSEKVGNAVVGALGAVRTQHPDVSFRAHALLFAAHGSLEGVSAKDYVCRFSANVPTGLGPSIGSGTVMYFGPEGERLLSSVTVDLSAIVSGGLYFRTHVVWDAKKVEIGALPKLVEAFLKQALGEIGLELPG